MQKHFIFSKKPALLFILLSAIFFLPEMAAEANSSSQNDPSNNIYLPIVSNATDSISQERVMSANHQATRPAILSDSRNNSVLEPGRTPVIRTTPTPDRVPTESTSKESIDIFTPQQIIFTVRSTNNASAGRQQINNCLQRIGLARDVTYMTNVWISSIRTRLFLYETSQDTHTERVVTDLQDATSSGANRVTAQRCSKIQTAQPNFLYAVNPWIGGGSPWIGGGSPWIGGGSNMAIAPAESLTNPQMVVNQPALENLVTGDLNSLEGFSGKGIRMAIFDTAPIDAPRGNEITIGNTQQWQLTVNTNKMRDPYQTVNDIPCDLEEGLTKEYTELMKEHGVYVASLVNAVAPDTEIELYRVLNHCGIGDLWTLIQVLEQFITSNGTQPAVINMSFGAVLSKDMFLTEENLKAEFTILWNLIETAREKGIAFVAASGNGSATATTPKTAEWPAAFPAVLSVAASDGVIGMSCFSNQGDIFAPGGNSLENWAFVPNQGFEFDELVVNEDGTITPGITAQDGTFQAVGCEPKMDECAENPDMCIIGQNREGRLSYLKGTSFSSPMVAAIVALAKEAYPDMSVGDLFTSIRKGTIPASQNPDVFIAQKNLNN